MLDHFISLLLSWSFSVWTLSQGNHIPSHGFKWPLFADDKYVYTHTTMHTHIFQTLGPYVLRPIGHLHLNAPKGLSHSTCPKSKATSHSFLPPCFHLLLLFPISEWHLHEANLLTKTRNLGIILSPFVFFTTPYQFWSLNPCDSTS